VIARKDIAAAGDGADEQRYAGRCRHRGLEPTPGRGIRVRLDEGEEKFTDGLLGEQQLEPARQCGDMLPRDRLGNWTYQFSVTVDDMKQRIDLVIRGEDLLPSTGRQLWLARMLGRSRARGIPASPSDWHPSGAKLSKANRDTGIRELRAAGITPAAVLGQAAFMTALQGRPIEVHPDQLPGLFETVF
jgi:glutamyl/glutaminyl-tRNA synthetase